MKPAAVRLSIIPAAFAAAIGMSLSVFLLPGASVRSEATPLLPASGPAGRVVVNLPAPANPRTSEPVRSAAPVAQLVATRTPQFVPQRRQSAPTAHRAHHPVRTRIVGGAPAPVRVAPPPPPAPTSPVKTIAGAPAPPAHGDGKAVGHSNDHHNGVPPGQAKKAPTTTPPVPGAPAPPKGNGGGNGHKGGKK